MKSSNINVLKKSKIKTYNILSKTLIVVFILINLFNFFPIDLFNPRWGNKFSLLFIDSFSILLLGIWLHKNSIIEIYFLKEGSLQKGQQDFLLFLESKKKRFHDLIKLSIISLVIINLFQIYIFIRGTNIIDYKLRLNLETIKNEYVYDENDEKYSEENIETFIQKANKASFVSASYARSDLIKSVLKIFTLSTIYGVSIKLLEKA